MEAGAGGAAGSTAVLNLIQKEYDASGAWVETEQNRYRIAADGSLTPLSFDLEFSNGIKLTGS